jgi:hypothetical protein
MKLSQKSFTNGLIIAINNDYITVVDGGVTKRIKQPLQSYNTYITQICNGSLKKPLEMSDK